MKVYNTLSARKEEFLPQGDEVKMYVCGITPYDHSHIGHGMSYIVFDVIRRYLQFRGYKVKYVQNITDIDDKIISRANQLGISASELAEKYASGYFADMADLNIAPADIYPRATQEIAKIIEVIQGLIDKGHAYAAQGSAYFRVRSKDDYGKLAHRSLKSMMAGARIEAWEEKEHPMDFALWKAAKPGEPSWPSPWGEGRPGWHIECSAMSLKYLGETLDIHGGGQDLIFPHHENEIAQSESFTGKKPFVKYWLHNGLLQLGEEKMSKSLGNLITIQEALEMYRADAIRIFVLSSHYQSPLTFSDEALEAAESGAERLRQTAHGGYATGAKKAKINVKTYHDRFIKAMDDDFGTPQALATLFDLAREINRADEAGYEAKEARGALKELAEVLGLTLKERELPPLDVEPLRELLISINEWRQLAGLKEIPVEKTPDDVEALMELITATRSALRDKKKWQQADMIRVKLDEAGTTLEDTPRGTVWRRKR
ncbi:MAG TPA: cysteine--tRNA ligase [Dehalococcoidales bacterium]|nr:cysteine--tRNA ligase [Dehalococcoidales bacterium]